jgi:hypothetical protein
MPRPLALTRRTFLRAISFVREPFGRRQTPLECAGCSPPTYLRLPGGRHSEYIAEIKDCDGLAHARAQRET